MQARRARVMAAVAAAAAALAVAAPALGQSGLTGVGLGGLPSALTPPNPLNSSGTVHPGFDSCPHGALRCPLEVIREMYRRWRPLHAKCDHRAVFALTYLRTTEAFLRAVTRDPAFFEDGPWVNREDAIFADFYFRAWDAYFGGARAPEAWRIAFEASRDPDLTGIGDLFLGMNAHISRDLPYTLAAVGLVKPEGGSRKPDHDKVNRFLADVAEPLQAELARRYDPLFATTDSPTPLDEGIVVEGVRALREQAWRNAEGLVNAQDEPQRDAASRSIEAQATAYAESIRAANRLPGHGAVRDAHCRANFQPSFTVRPRPARLRTIARRGRLGAVFTADGPAEFVLRSKLIATGRQRGARGAAKWRARLTVPRRVRTGRAGRRAVRLKLTRRGRKLVRRTRRARIKVVLIAPRGVRARGARWFRR